MKTFKTLCSELTEAFDKGEDSYLLEQTITNLGGFQFEPYHHLKDTGFLIHVVNGKNPMLNVARLEKNYGGVSYRLFVPSGGNKSNARFPSNADWVVVVFNPPSATAANLIGRNLAVKWSGEGINGLLLSTATWLRKNQPQLTESDNVVPPYTAYDAHIRPACMALRYCQHEKF